MQWKECKFVLLDNQFFLPHSIPWKQNLLSKVVTYKPQKLHYTESDMIILQKSWIRQKSYLVIQVPQLQNIPRVNTLIRASFQKVLNNPTANTKQFSYTKLSLKYLGTQTGWFSVEATTIITIKHPKTPLHRGNASS